MIADERHQHILGRWKVDGGVVSDLANVEEATAQVPTEGTAQSCGLITPQPSGQEGSIVKRLRAQLQAPGSSPPSSQAASAIFLLFSH